MQTFQLQSEWTLHKWTEYVADAVAHADEGRMAHTEELFVVWSSHAS